MLTKKIIGCRLFPWAALMNRKSNPNLAASSRAAVRPTPTKPREDAVPLQHCGSTDSGRCCSACYIKEHRCCDNSYSGWCQKKDVVLQVHHITPRRFGGGEEPTNKALLCSKCHHRLHALYADRAQREAQNRNPGWFNEALMEFMKNALP